MKKLTTGCFALALGFFWLGVVCVSRAGAFDFTPPLSQETGTYGQKGFSFQLAEVSKRDAPKEKQETIPASPGMVPDSAWWVRATAGYDYAFLGDLINGTKDWASLVHAEGGNSSSTTDKSGFLLGLETGWRLDGDNSFSLSFENVWSSNQSLSATLPIGSDDQNLSPSLLDGSVNYYRCLHGILGGKDDRTFITLGAGYYHATVNYSLVQTGSPNVSGTFTGDILGGTLGLTQEFKLLRDLGLDISVRGRLANFSQVSAANVTGSQAIVPGYSGPFSLVLMDAPYGGTTYKILVFDANSRVGSFDHYAAVDYSGVDADVSFSYYF